jgi:chromosome segregation ATPase
MQAELASAQEGLKAARAESSRRLRELQALQSLSQVSASAGSDAAAALAAETAAREAAEMKLRDVKASLARKKQLVTDLRKRVRDCHYNANAFVLSELKECAADWTQACKHEIFSVV